MAYSNVLFVDDNFFCHLENCEFLRESGLHIVEVYTPSEAFEVIADSAVLTALLTDVELGASIDGFEIARRARDAYPRLPVVFMSGTSAVRHRCEGVARSEFISKPFQPQQILEALDRVTFLEAA